MAANLKHLKHKYIEAIKERDFYANRCCELTEIEFDKDAQIKAFIHSSQNWQRISERYKSHLETIRLNRSSAEDIDKMLSEVR